MPVGQQAASHSVLEFIGHEASRGGEGLFADADLDRLVSQEVLYPIGIPATTGEQIGRRVFQAEPNLNAVRLPAAAALCGEVTVFFSSKLLTLGRFHIDILPADPVSGFKYKETSNEKFSQNA
jgi:hypothetical protein